GHAICGDAAAVSHACQRPDGRLEQVMAYLALDVCHQAETAVVSELPWVIQTRSHNCLSICLCRGMRRDVLSSVARRTPHSLPRGGITDDGFSERVKYFTQLKIAEQWNLRCQS